MMRHVISSALALAFQAGATTVNFRGSGRLSKRDAEVVLFEEVADTEHHVGGYVESLRDMFASLPKNRHGKLDHNIVRYALHRFFVSRHGWYIGGLEPRSAADTSALPNVIQNSFEMITGEGADLKGLATLAAALDDLAEREVHARMKDVYAAGGVATDSPLDHLQADDVLQTFLVSFMVANNWTADSKADLDHKKKIFKERFRDFKGTMAWYEPIREKYVHEGTNDFEALVKVASEATKTYHTYNDVNCKTMRSVLKDAESKKPGRVRLSHFYNMSIYGGWDFNERVEFLRALGVLDESDPKQTSIIIPNYAVSRLNCLNATNVYAICCRNVCDDLVFSLEKEIGAPMASAEKIVKFVSNLASESVSAPRALPASLVSRLEEVAAIHKGQVPLHGRLFAQFMHHAYPLECPYPQEAGTVSVQTPEEWMAQTGEATQEASLEEMQTHVASDVCALKPEGKPECGEVSTELPWSMSEELLTSPAVDQSSSDAGLYTVLAVWCLVGALVLARPLLSKKLGAAQRRDVVMRVALALTAAAYLADVLDRVIFGLALLGNVVSIGVELTTRHYAEKRLVLPKMV